MTFNGMYILYVCICTRITTTYTGRNSTNTGYPIVDYIVTLTVFHPASFGETLQSLPCSLFYPEYSPATG